ncbi:MAG: class I SAM-dependent methyltransferase [Rhodothermaceae bacterium]|nr:class I SAM-dependent methyltransferase [Rhodothermaceae bacterium]MYE63786.1 class I SAM-dependent methyltransferase [Rhodothermaceae bacterium]MYJ19411.1 class I SAM-dependent methyltransferase [Rhodothermaceae bacterium]
MIALLRSIPVWQWMFHVGLCTSIFVLGLVSVDRGHLPLVFGLVIFGSVCWILCWRIGKFSLKTVLIYAFLFRLSLIGLPPSLSDDAYRYVWDGVVQHEGINPYKFAPEDASLFDLHQDTAFDRLNSKSFISVYPPVSQLIFWFGTVWHQPDGFLSYYLIKGLLILAELFAVLILARLVSAGFVLLYAWNPVVILETAGQAHTESALLLALILVIYLVQNNHERWASIFLAIGGWIKLFPFLFFPYLWRRYGWDAVWPGAITAILLALPFAAPYVLPNVSGSLDLYARFFEFNSGLYYSLKSVLQWLTGEDWSKQLGPFLRLIFLCSLPVLYTLDLLQRWSMARAMIITTGCYLVLSTTVHPWYLLVPLFLAASLQAHGWHWIWLGVWSVATYLLYVDGPYWIFVIVGWAGWGIAGTLRYAPKWLQSLMRARASKKFKRIRPFFPKNTGIMTVLDLGCAEGYVGESIQKELGTSVTLADVVPMNQTDLPYFSLKQGPLPWPSKHFDVVLLYHVLHHAKNTEMLLREAMRVCRGRVIVVESVYTTSFQYKLLTILDRLANRLRSFGKMNAQEEDLYFRTSQQWRELFLTNKANMLAEFESNVVLFTSAGFVLQPSSEPV